MPRKEAPSSPPSPAVEILPGFVPVATLWSGDRPPYPSANSAQWAINKNRAELISAEAVAYHRGRLMVHPARLVEVMGKAAINQAKSRFSDLAGARP